MLCRIFSLTLTFLVLYGRVKDACGCGMPQKTVCGPDPCLGMICLYGKAKDQNGCIICDCNDPCLNVNCPEGYRCEGVKNAATNTYSGQCRPFQTVTRAPCQAVRCMNTCPYSYKADSRGCQSCECSDPCENRCGVNQRCVIDDCFFTNDCRDQDTYCVDTSTPAMVVNNFDILPTPSLTMEEKAQAALHQCCPSLGLSNSCLETCLTNPTQLFSDFSSCFRSNKIWDYMSCISDASAVKSTPAMVVNNFDILPTTDHTMEESSKAALRQCCVSVGLSNKCLEACLNNPSQLFSEFSSCLRSSKVWDYLRCISATSLKDSEPAKESDLLGSLLGSVGSKILNFRLLHKESIQDSETEIEAETKIETDPAAVDAVEGQVHEDEYQP